MFFPLTLAVIFTMVPNTYGGGGDNPDLSLKIYYFLSYFLDNFHPNLNIGLINKLVYQFSFEYFLVL